MIRRTIDYISVLLEKQEARSGLFFTSCIVAVIFMVTAMLYVQPLFDPAFHGIQFSLLSEAPFDYSAANALRYRILSPFIGYVLFLRGPYFFIVPFAAAWIFTGTVYYQYRRKNLLHFDALLLTCFVAFSSTILIPFVAPGYTDVVTWLFIFMAFMKAEKIPWSAFYFSLALLNHESSLAVLPALIMYCIYTDRKSILKILVCFLLACVPHLCYRWFVNMHAETMYNTDFYFSSSNVLFSFRKLFLFLPAAVFYTFKLWWIFPICFTVWSLARKNFLQPAIILLLIGGALSLLIISYDYTRMMVICFPAVLLSYKWLMETVDRNMLRKFTLVLVALNFLVLQYHFNYDGAQPMFPWILNKVSAFFGTPLI